MLIKGHKKFKLQTHTRVNCLGMFEIGYLITVDLRHVTNVTKWKNS
jgi:hypothetical protein